MIETQKNSDEFIDACSDSELLYSFDICSRTTRSKSIQFYESDWTLRYGSARKLYGKSRQGVSVRDWRDGAINAVYSPQTASVDFGLIAPDGLFYGLNTTTGSFDKAIKVSQRGRYYFAVKTILLKLSMFLDM